MSPSAAVFLKLRPDEALRDKSGGRFDARMTEVVEWSKTCFLKGAGTNRQGDCVVVSQKISIFDPGTLVFSS